MGAVVCLHLLRLCSLDVCNPSGKNLKQAKKNANCIPGLLILEALGLFWKDYFQVSDFLLFEVFFFFFWSPLTWEESPPVFFVIPKALPELGINV